MLKVSALYGQGLEVLRRAMGSRLSETAHNKTLRVGWAEAAAWRIVYGELTIVSRTDFEDGAELVLRGPARAFHGLSRALSGSRHSPGDEMVQ